MTPPRAAGKRLADARSKPELESLRLQALKREAHDLGQVLRTLLQSGHPDRADAKPVVELLPQDVRLQQFGQRLSRSADEADVGSLAARALRVNPAARLEHPEHGALHVGRELLDALQIQRAAGKTEGGGELELPAELCGRQPPAVDAEKGVCCAAGVFMKQAGELPLAAPRRPDEEHGHVERGDERDLLEDGLRGWRLGHDTPEIQGLLGAVSVRNRLHEEHRSSVRPLERRAAELEIAHARRPELPAQHRLGRPRDGRALKRTALAAFGAARRLVEEKLIAAPSCKILPPVAPHEGAVGIRHRMVRPHEKPRIVKRVEDGLQLRTD